MECTIGPRTADEGKFIMSVTPVQWAKLKDIDDVQPVGPDDAQCLADVKAALEKHGMASRFGVALLHAHFPMGDDEVMLETGHDETRCLSLEPISVNLVGENAIGTIWSLEGDSPNPEVMCQLTIFGSH